NPAKRLERGKAWRWPSQRAAGGRQRAGHQVASGTQPQRDGAPAAGSGMLLVARRAITRPCGVAFAHVRTVLGVAVGLATIVVINLAVEVDPHHRVAGTARLRLRL